MLKMLHNVGLVSSRGSFVVFIKEIHKYKNICQNCDFYSFCHLGIERVSFERPVFYLQ
jgi:hypothetical protein